eukprot:TRINITY_DN13221_c0_g2_i1.p1 TRINITY_DN13221_c0_g2~~TRINITY_DN13221_c0_g2_i1.p1  ORF type:complete len:554 (+),score=70.03 TRINITY_DN13221_c0_g2_i1:136-1662(+)
MFPCVLVFQALAVTAPSIIEQVAGTAVPYRRQAVDSRGASHGDGEAFRQADSAVSVHGRSAFVASMQIMLHNFRKSEVIDFEAELGHEVAGLDARDGGVGGGSGRTMDGGEVNEGGTRKKQGNGSSGGVSSNRSRARSEAAGITKAKAPNSSKVGSIGNDYADVVDDSVNDVAGSGSGAHTTASMDTSASAITTVGCVSGACGDVNKKGVGDVDGGSPACAGEATQKGGLGPRNDTAKDEHGHTSVMAANSANAFAGGKTIALVVTASRRGSGLSGARIVLLLVGGSALFIFGLTAFACLRAWWTSLYPPQRPAPYSAPPRRAPVEAEIETYPEIPEIVQSQEDVVSSLILLLEANVWTCFRDNGAPPSDEKDWQSSYVAIDSTPSGSSSDRSSRVCKCSVSFWDSAEAYAGGTLAMLVWPLEVIDQEIGLLEGRPDIVQLTGSGRFAQTTVRRRGLLRFECAGDAVVWAATFRALLGHLRKDGTVDSSEAGAGQSGGTIGAASAPRK